MMRYLFASTVLVLLATPAMALESTDTMQSWNTATPSDKKALFDRMSKGENARASKDGVVTCIDDAAKMSAHSNLVISEVYKACSEQSVKDNI